MSKIIAIYDEDTKYMYSFSLYINERANIGFDCVGFDDKDLFLDYISSNKVDIILSTFDTKKYINNNVKKYIFTEIEGNLSDEYIYKYQKISSIIQIILREYCKKNQNDLTYVDIKKSKIICYFSKNDSDKSIQRAYKLIVEEYTNKKALFCTLSVCPLLDEIYVLDEANITDLLAFSQNQKGISKEILQSTIVSKEVDIIPTTTASVDFIDIEYKKWKELIDQISRRSGYEFFIIYLTTNIQKYLKLLEDFDEVIYIDEIKDERFIETLKKRGINNIRAI